MPGSATSGNETTSSQGCWNRQERGDTAVGGDESNIALIGNGQRRYRYAVMMSNIALRGKGHLSQRRWAKEF